MKPSDFLALENLLAGRTDDLFGEIVGEIVAEAARGKRRTSAKNSALGDAETVRAAVVARLCEKHGLAPPGANKPERNDGISVYGWFNAESGFGKGGRALVEALRARQIPVSAHNLVAQTFDNSVPFEVAADLLAQFGTLVFFVPPQWFLHRFPDLPAAAAMGRHRVGYWPWELPVFPAAWAEALAMVHEIWTPSAFSARAIAEATKLPIHIVPHPIVLPAIAVDEARRQCRLPADAFIFLTAFDLNSFPARKNALGTLKAFLDAFPNRTPSSPRLIIKCHGKGHRQSADFREMTRLARDPRVILIDEVYSTERMQTLQAACDCFVSLHRSEGFGLNIAESMGFGKPCVATGFSGNLDFMTHKNSILIPYRMRRVQSGEYVRGEGQWWADPVHEAAVAALQAVAAGGVAVMELAANARADIARDYSLTAIGARIEAIWRGSAKPLYGGAA